MSYSFLRVFLPIYIVVLGLATFVWRIIIFRKKTGKNPVIMGRVETAHGYVSRILQYVVAAEFFSVFVYSFFPDAYRFLFPIYLQPAFILVGLALLALGFAVVFAAQVQMGASWRVGIETTEKTAIVRHGLYRFSRNPIYLGLYMANLGLFLIIPSVLTLLCWVSGHIALQTLIRLEEAHLLKLHGESFEKFRAAVRRWL